MNIAYLIPALIISFVVYRIGLWLVNNISLEEDAPKKSFRKSVHDFFTNKEMYWVDRWILGETLISIVLGLSFLSIFIYKSHAITGDYFEFDANRSYITHNTLLFLSLICAIPLGIWVLRLGAIFLIFSSFNFDYVDVHWLKWLVEFSDKRKKKGCLWSLLRVLHFFILCIQMLFSYVISYLALSLFFSY